VARTRRTSLELGIWDLDGAARALMAGRTADDPIAYAEAAVRLAPDLPAGRMALAHTLWRHDDSPLEALRVAFDSLWVIPRHIEASLWFGGSLLFVLGLSCVLGGLWCIALIGVVKARHAAHDLGDLLSGSMPAFSRLALIASALLAPAAFGEGLLGVGAVLLAIGAVYGSMRQRLTLVLAASVVVFGAFPVVRLAGNTLTALSTDPVAAAAFSTDQGFTYPADQVRIDSAADHDLLAAQALALRARREGNLGAADAHYQALLRRDPNDPAIVNNAANVRLNLGHMESALALYRRSVELEPNPVVLFNLSQAHGRAFQVEDLSQTLAEAQRLDGDLVAELTALQGAEPVGFVVDLPIETRQVWQRILRSNSGERVAEELRASLAPGRLGDDSLVTEGVFVGITFLFGVLGSRLRRSSLCSRCGRRMCPRCHPELGRGSVCSGCTRLFHKSETTDRELRLTRIGELRAREARIERLVTLASFAVPGAAGMAAGGSLRTLLGSLLAALALLSIVWRGGVVPDPLVAGASSQLAFLCIALVATFFYALLAFASLVTRRNS
jgi:tetratricopeptide (TPR) repeat protein